MIRNGWKGGYKQKKYATWLGRRLQAEEMMRNGWEGGYKQKNDATQLERKL